MFTGLVGLLFAEIERRPGRSLPESAPTDAAWSRARQRLDALSAQYAAYERDPQEVLRLPALADVTVPSTREVVAAFAHAQALRTDAPPRTRGARDPSPQSPNLLGRSPGRHRASSMTAVPQVARDQAAVVVHCAGGRGAAAPSDHRR